MKTSLSSVAAVAMFIVAGPSHGATRSSANYQITTETMDGGGAASAGGVYQMNSSIGSLGGIAGDAGGLVTIRSGFIGQLPSFVVGRWIFYNQSFWDGNDAAATASDDSAIAPDKTALLPGGLATLANYTSYSRGINGIMVDVTELSADPTVADFIFRVGNDQTPAGWGAAPAPTSVSVRYGAGIGGSDRVTLIWNNLAIKKQWLQVTALADASTGLASSDVFYFGNAVGETGNSLVDAKVTSADALRVLNNVTLTPNLSSLFDINRDGKVTTSDYLVVLNNVSAIQPVVLLDLRVGVSSLAKNSVQTLQRVKTIPTTVSWDEGGLRLVLSEGAGAAAGLGEGTLTVWSAESLDAVQWEPVDVAPTHTSGSGHLEFRLPTDSHQPARFYRLEVRLDR